MRLSDFRVTKFRNIVDSGSIKADESITCLVGKNEAGKSGILEALYLLNPAYKETFNVDEQYPRWLVVSDRRKNDLNAHSPISATFVLEDEDIDAIANIIGTGVLTGKEFVVERNYGNECSYYFSWNEDTAVTNFVTKLPPSIQKNQREISTFADVVESISSLESSNESGGPTTEEVLQAQSLLSELNLSDRTIEELITNELASRIPLFFRFTEYSTLPGRIDFQDLVSLEESGPGQSGMQAARALLNLAGTDLDQLTNENYELRKGELEAVQIDLTNQVFEFWKQNPQLEVLIDVDKETVPQARGHSAVSRFLDIRLRDKRTGYSNNFSQRSSGFQWFFSFLAAFSEFELEDKTVVLLDEPALSLHGKAQADFLRFINERLAPDSSVIYTTHSPFMVDSGALERVRIVEDHGPPKGAVASDQVFATDPDSLFPLQAALGYDIAQSLFIGPHNLVVEGTSDFIYLSSMSQFCVESGRCGLDERWRLLPAGGATNIPTFVSLVGPHLDATVLADSDAKGMQRVQKMAASGLLQGHRLVLVNEITNTKNADIEDLFSEGDYLKLYNQTFSTKLKVGDLPKGDRIVKRIETLIDQKYDHGKVAESLLRHDHSPFTESTLNRFNQLFERINATLGT